MADLKVYKALCPDKDTFAVIFAMEQDKNRKIVAEWHGDTKTWVTQTYLTDGDGRTLIKVGTDTETRIQAISMATAKMLETLDALREKAKKKEQNRRYYLNRKKKLTDEDKAKAKAYQDEYRRTHKERKRENDRRYQAEKGYDAGVRRMNYLKVNPKAKSVPRLTPDEKAMITALHEQGVSNMQIAKRTGRCVPTITRYLSRV